MILLRVGLFVLMICTPWLVDAQKKVILLMPRHVKRSHGMPWRQFSRPPFAKATQFLDHEFLPSQRSPKYLFPMMRHKNPMIKYTKNVPHGGDDFDQGHEDVNHILVPHGKGITHAISFGKGYVPQDALIHHAGFGSSSNSLESVDEAVSYNSITPVYITPQMSHQADIYLQQYDHNDEDNYHQDGIQERRIDDIQLKFLKAKGIANISPQDSRKVILHSASPNANQGIVLRDSINFEDYNKKVTELTKTWPQSLGGHGAPTVVAQPVISAPQPVLPAPSINLIATKPETIQTIPGLQHLQAHSSINVANYPESSNLITAIKLHSPGQGYAVKEDLHDVPHDFRTMPISTSGASGGSLVSPTQLPLNSALHVVSQPAQQQSFSHSLAQISSPAASSPALPGYYALSGFPGLVHG